jgi:hypothetical protein
MKFLLATYPRRFVTILLNTYYCLGITEHHADAEVDPILNTCNYLGITPV